MPRPSILVVEDNPINLKLLVTLLETEDYKVHQAVTGEEVLEATKRIRPDLILLDINLPGVDGLTLAHALRRDPATAAIRIVAVTARAMKEDREAILGAGCDAFVPKPIDTRALLAQVRQLLEPKIPAHDPGERLQGPHRR